MPEVVDDARRPGQLVPVRRGQAAQREPVEIAAAGEQDDQQDREQEGRHRVADDDQARGPDVEPRAVAHRLGDAEGNRDQIGQERRPDAERDRNRHPFDHEVGDLAVLEEALAEIEGQVVAQHDEEALVHRLVEAELLLQFRDELRVQPLGAAIASRRPLLLGRGLGAGADLGARPAAEACRGLDRGALQPGEDLLDRAAGGRLDDQEVEDHDPEQRRDHQQQAADDIGDHRGRMLRDA